MTATAHIPVGVEVQGVPITGRVRIGVTVQSPRITARIHVPAEVRETRVGAHFPVRVRVYTTGTVSAHVPIGVKIREPVGGEPVFRRTIHRQQRG